MSDDTTSSRKLDHVRIVMGEDVAAKGVYTGFAAYRMPHDAVPELDLAEIDTSTIFLGKPLRDALLSAQSMVKSDVLPTTLRLEPR